MEIVTKVILSHIIKRSFEKCLSVFAELKLSPGTDEKVLEKSINEHIAYIENWTSSLSFREIHESKSTLNVYVKLGFSLNRRRTYFGEVIESKIEIEELLASSKNHIVILGQPGAGKTTSIKYISQLMIWDEHFCIERFKFPMVVRLRELRHSISGSSIKSLFYHLEGIVGFSFQLIEEKTESKLDKKKAKISDSVFSELKFRGLMKYLDSLQVLLILDGLDEIGTPEEQRKVARQISDMCLYLSKSMVVITSRTADYSFDISNTSIYELAPLNDEKVREFTKKWLGSDRQSKMLLNAIRESPFYDAAMRPLTLAHLCAIYEREAKIPKKPKTVYRLVIELLLKEWDIQRGVARETEYSGFEVDRKFDFLSKLAYTLCKDKYKVNFSSIELSSAYNEICHIFNLPNNQAKQVVNEIESHSGLVLQATYDLYEFAHKSLQEYFIAECISRLSEIPNDFCCISKYPNELAICVALSSNPNEYFIHLVFFRFAQFSIEKEFYSVFMDRVILENPDFYKSYELGLAVAYLCSKKTNKHYKGFRGLSNNEQLASSLQLILNHYKVTGMMHRDTGIKLNKINDIPNQKLNVLMPKELIIEQELLSIVAH